MWNQHSMQSRKKNSTKHFTEKANNLKSKQYLYIYNFLKWKCSFFTKWDQWMYNTIQYKAKKHLLNIINMYNKLSYWFKLNKNYMQKPWTIQTICQLAVLSTIKTNTLTLLVIICYCLWIIFKHNTDETIHDIGWFSSRCFDKV